MMMLRSAVPHFRYSNSLLHLQSTRSVVGGGVNSRIGCRRLDSMKCCATLRDYSGIPYLGTFSKPRSTYDNLLHNLPVIDKAHHQLSDCCTKLEGEPCFDCWLAVFNLYYLSLAGKKEEVEKMIKEARGNKHLIERIGEMTRAHKMRQELGAQNDADDDSKEEHKLLEILKPVKKKTMMTSEERADKLMEEKGIRVPDGVIPPSWEELEEMERRNMAESSHARLLRYIGGYPSWYVPRPDHETD